ncbi:eukaryotic translation initiation factor 3 subunit C-like [Centruroides sculpturatus]|uniref:eukaryotic translation initiation factor 3 subunit C-like n=1 Tax=Centruroides sculpturatus TaxID=218467 RepID=UPI000C6EF9E3|nr:eukaryotic translation initiation factor 3 subunit C-like [Centruroides sculpturatus]
MSRFFATGSESESESSSSEEEQAQSKTTGITSTFTFSDEEEETKRVVRSAREKRYEELVDIIKQVKNHKKIKDMSKLLTSFENLSRAFMKAKPVIDKEEGGMTPKFYIRCLVELEDFINNVCIFSYYHFKGEHLLIKFEGPILYTDRIRTQAMLCHIYHHALHDNWFEARDLMLMSHLQENIQHSDVPTQDKPSNYEVNRSDDEIQDEDFIKKPIIKEEKEELKSKFIKGSDDEESDDDSLDWGSSSEEESSLSSDDEKYAGNLAAKFLKKSADEQKEMKKREKKRDKERKERKREDDDDDEGKWEEVKGGVPLIMEKPKMFAKDAEINHQVVLKKLTEILAARGKKGTDRSEQIDLLNELMDTVKTHALGPAMEVKIMFAIISAIYDYNPNIATCMKIEMWQKCLEFINKLLDILVANSSINVGEHISEDSEVFSSVPYRVRGCILTMIERMDEEFTKMLQGCDAHSPEYVERLKDEKEVCQIIQRVQDYLEERGTPSELCRIYLRHIEHLYYKFDQNVFKWKESRSHKEEKEQQPENAVNGEKESEEEKKDDVPEEPNETSLLIMDRLCKFIYVKDSTDRIRTQAMLCHIYHHALHDNWFEARDLMLMSHLQENIQHSDVPTQILQLNNNHHSRKHIEREKPCSIAMKGFSQSTGILDESDDDSLDWGSSSEEESSLSSDDEKYAGNLAAKFLKKSADEQKEMKKREKKRDKERKERKREDDDDDEGKWEEVKGGVPLIMEKPKMFAKDAEINHQVVLKKLTEILAARGKKGTDRSEQIDLLNELMDTVKTHALGPAMEVKIMFAIISAIYDYNPNIATCMKIEMWQKCLEFINKLLDILVANSSINVGEHISEDSEVFSSVPYRVRGCILTMIERMDEEFTKMLQGCDAHSPEYVERLKDEKEVCQIIQRVQDYLEERGTPSELCRIYLRHIEHLYYKFDQNVFKWKESRSHKEEKEQQPENAVNGEKESEEEKKDDVPEEPNETSLLIMDRLCKFIYVKDSTDRIRTQAMLCHIYHHALHDNWFEARDLMLMSHLQENIQHSDVPTQESDDDSLDWGSSSEEESSLSSDDEKYAGNLAAKFLKKSADEQKEMKKREKKRDKERKERKREDDDDDEGKWEEVKGGVPLIMEKPKMFAKDAEINHQVVLKKLTEILAARGKKGTDRSEQIDLLNELMDTVKTHALGPAMEVKIMFAIISAIYDYNPNIATCMKIEMWQKCLEFINKLLDILVANSSINVGEHISEDSEVFSSVPYRVRGCILTMIERMDEEFTKMLQGCDAHSPEYVERLKDEKEVCQIIQRVQDYLEERGTPSELCRIYLRHIEHLYYKFDQNVFKWKESRSHKEEKEQQPENAVNGEKESEEEKKDDVPEEPNETSLLIMDRLCKFIYVKDSTDRIRTQAMLCHIYHHALHDNWFEARDLMLMSHLQENIQHSDVPTQILYNRALVQLGLCSFRHGNIKDAHNALLDIQSGGRAKELLAQGLLPQRQHERTTEQEKIEKRRQVPFHKHINLELLECVYLVSAMLLEIPYMSAHELDGRKRMISKSFHHQLRNSERQPLVGPPESMREHVVAASKAMRIGNWRQCKNYIINEKMNAKVWDLFYQADKVRDMISQKIQEESLRTYLFTYSHVYDSISMNILSEMFELDKSVVHSIISKMIINEELMASLDEPTQTVVMHRTEPSRIQALSLQLADKVTNLIDQNERLAEVKQGSFFGRSMGQQSGFRDSSYQKNVYNQQGNFREVNYQKGTYSQSSNFRDSSYQKTAYGADRWVF